MTVIEPPVSRSPSPPLPHVPPEDENDHEEGEGSPALMIPAPNRHSMDHGYGSDAPRRPPRFPCRSSSPALESSTQGLQSSKCSMYHHSICQGEASTRRSQSHSNNNTPNDRLTRSSSLNSVPEISIEPPSRPQSNSSREALNSGSNFLSPADADRQIPLPTAPAPNGQLPPGFIHSGPSLPATPASRLNGIYESGPGGNAIARPGTSITDQIPGGFPSMADQYMSLRSRRSFRAILAPVDAVADGTIPQPSTMPVIPPPSSKYSHLDDDDDDAVSSTSSSANTLTTPPPRRLRIRRRASASPYAAAPVPPGVVYPHGIESIGIPVPPPGSGSGTPRSSHAREGGNYATPRTLNPALRPSESKHSLHSPKWHKHFDKEGYLDSAFLASSSAEDVNAGVGKSRR
ncbi:hypothetical protein PILCRDRAFT_8862 [Piloderma croceum F 1598]|uniref:Uncharacterized protein n=1 Tax=Piloderma croceum (strain F 1598) TaxID=765440 RepID=A0A0C3BV22_PILCF|nr:hypothetical protein PILCRDRAFT_8862 [Piloderma croceum F 1598]